MPPLEQVVVYTNATLPSAEFPQSVPEGPETPSDVSVTAQVAPADDMEDVLPTTGSVAIETSTHTPEAVAYNFEKHKNDECAPQALRDQQRLPSTHDAADDVQDAVSSHTPYESSSDSDEEEEHDEEEGASESESSVHTSHGASSSTKIPALSVSSHPIVPILRHEPPSEPYALPPPSLPPPPDNALDGMTVQHASKNDTTDTVAPTHYHLLFMGIGVLSAFLLGLLAAPYI
jgi:hypothetical protein